MKKIALIMSVVMLIALTAGGMTALAEEKAAKMEVLTGEVLNVDTDAGKIVIMADDMEQTLQAEPKMLEGIGTGQNVTIEKSGDLVKSIKAE